LRSLDSEGVKLRDVGLRRPTLDDVFLSLTGRMTDDEIKPEYDETKEVAA
jgi:ABC-2 type transport system ATP-binding protein